MTDWSAISNVATGGGTLVLAVATFASVRSANRSARAAELAVRQSMRPVLTTSRLEDRTEKIYWGDQFHAKLPGGQLLAERRGDNIYLAMSLRNVGNGIAVLRSWDLHVRDEMPAQHHYRSPELFRQHTRDLYVPPGGLGFWQAALRDRDEEFHPIVSRMLADRHPFHLDVLYTDHEGQQASISRFTAFPADDGRWLSSVVRYWSLADVRY